MATAAAATGPGGGEDKVQEQRSVEESLLHAAGGGCVGALRELLADGAPVDARDTFGCVLQRFRHSSCFFCVGAFKQRQCATSLACT